VVAGVLLGALGVVGALGVSCGGSGGSGAPEGTVRWPFSTGGRVLHAPDVVDDVVLLEVQLGEGASATGAIVALDRSSGEERWRFQAPGDARLVRARATVAPFDGPPLVVRDMVLIASAAPDGAGALSAHRLDGTDEEWRVETGNGSDPPLASADDDRVVFRQDSPAPGVDSRVVALETKSGKEKWTSDVAAAGEPVVVGDDVVYETVDGDTVIAEAGNGDVRFTARKRAFRSVTVDVFVLRDVGGDLVGLSIDELQEEWRISPPGGLCDDGAMAIDDALYMITSECGEEQFSVLAVDAELQTVDSVMTLRAGRVEQVVFDDGVLVITTSSLGAGSRVTAVDLDARGELWHLDLDQVFVQVSLDERSVYLVDDNRDLVALDRETGEERWSTTGDEVVSLVPTVVDGQVYAAFSGSSGSGSSGSGSSATGSSTPDGDVAPAASGSEPTELRSFESGDGDVRWSLAVAGNAVIGSDGSRLYVADGEGVVRAIE
jgi:outer membrane protein assembly factor BamB